jgi:hypothetical protein
VFEYGPTGGVKWVAGGMFCIQSASSTESIECRHGEVVGYCILIVVALATRTGRPSTQHTTSRSQR